MNKPEEKKIVYIGNSIKELKFESGIGDYPNTGCHVDGISFDGHRVLWGFSYEPHNYLKESELSGEEYRKGGWIRYFRNKIQVYEEFCREAENAIPKLQTTLWKLQEIDWDNLVGRKIFYERTPAIIKSLILEQGCAIIIPDGVSDFPDPVYAEEEWQKNEESDHLKVDLISPKIWWYRK